MCEQKYLEDETQEFLRLSIDPDNHVPVIHLHFKRRSDRGARLTLFLLCTRGLRATCRRFTSLRESVSPFRDRNHWTEKRGVVGQGQRPGPWRCGQRRPGIRFSLALSSQVATIKEVLTFRWPLNSEQRVELRLQESAVDAILTGKRKAQRSLVCFLFAGPTPCESGSLRPVLK